MKKSIKHKYLDICHAVEFIKKDCDRIKRKLKSSKHNYKYPLKTIFHTTRVPLIIPMEFDEFKKQYKSRTSLIINYINKLGITVSDVYFRPEECCGIAGAHGYFYIIGFQRIKK